MFKASKFTLEGSVLFGCISILCNNAVQCVRALFYMFSEGEFGALITGQDKELFF